MALSLQLSVFFVAASCAAGLQQMAYDEVSQLIRKEMRDVEEAQGEGACKEEIVVDGNFCEESCIAPEIQAFVQKEGGASGTCKENGFTQQLGDLIAYASVGHKDSSTPRAKSDLDLPEGCHAHFKAENDLCETFCIKSEQDRHFAENRGFKPGECSDEGFPNYVGQTRVTTYVKSSK